MKNQLKQEEEQYNQDLSLLDYLRSKWELSQDEYLWQRDILICEYERRVKEIINK